MKVSTLMLLCSLALFVPAFLLWRKHRELRADAQAFVRSARPASARVVALNWVAPSAGIPDSSTQDRAFPVVEFELPDGQTVRAQTRTGRYPKPASVGDTVRVLYDPTQPTRVDLASQAPRTFLHTVYALLSFGFASGGVLGVLMWWLLFRVMGIPA